MSLVMVRGLMNTSAVTSVGFQLLFRVGAPIVTNMMVASSRYAVICSTRYLNYASRDDMGNF